MAARNIRISALLLTLTLVLAAPAQARRLVITPLGSYHAERHSRPTLPNTPYYYCEHTGGAPLIACCLWNQAEDGGFGAWDCQIIPADRRRT